MNELQRERTQLFNDVYLGQKPKRIPIMADIDDSYAMQLASLDLRKAKFDWEMTSQAYDTICAALPECDQLPLCITRYAPVYKLLGSKSFVMAKDGFMQHPEISCMQEDEYPEFIKDPYKFILDKALPRINANLSTSSPMSNAKALATSYHAFNDIYGKICAKEEEIIEKYSYAQRPPILGGLTAVDFVGSSLRGFSNISVDFRRRPQLVKEAAEAFMPVEKIMTTIMPGHVEIFLLLPPFMNEKTFQNVYWPTFKELVDFMAESGQTVRLWCERDWMRYLDWLTELPDNINFYFELGESKLVKEKIGTRQIVSGLFPTDLLRSGSAAECSDKAKELVDIMGAGGGYIFDIGRTLLNLNDAKIENLQAVVKTIKAYGIY